MYKVLVVDDDRTCLILLTAHLEKWNYEVTTVENAHEALDMLRTRSFDLVLSDVHMPDINGIELLRQIDQEFRLPVILISADGSEEVMLTGAKNGAQYFLVKPIEARDVKEIWQFIEWWNRNKNKCTSVVTQISESASNRGVERVDHDNGHGNNVDAGDALSSHTKSKAGMNVDGADAEATIGSVGDETTGGTIKKVAWTKDLHRRFVEAMLVIGYKKAGPTKMLQIMDVPGLTIRHIASHLQKYRKFLGEVVEGKVHIKSSDWIDLDYQSSVVSGNPDLLLLEQFREHQGQKRKLMSYNVNIQVPNGSSSSAAYSPVNVASGGLASAILPKTYNKNIVNDVNTLANVQNNYSLNGGLVGGAINGVIPPANNVTPFGPAPLYNQSINVGVQGNNNAYNGNIYNTNQFKDNRGNPSIAVSSNANQLGSTSTMNAEQLEIEQMIKELL